MDYEEFLNHREDYIAFDKEYNIGDSMFDYPSQPKDKKINYTPFVPPTEDKVNRPKHYTYGKSEAIDVIEEAISNAPSHKAAFNHGQVLKYLLRLWHKDNSVEDAKKARWYLNRLIEQLDGEIKWNL